MRGLQGRAKSGDETRAEGEMDKPLAYAFLRVFFVFNWRSLAELECYGAKNRTSITIVFRRTTENKKNSAKRVSSF